MLEYRGKTAVVTGAGSGIGSGIAIALARAGANVAVADIEADAAEETARQVRSFGASAMSMRTDVSSYADVRQLQAAVQDRFGDVHVLCNNAGVSVKRRGIHASHADWEWLVGVNLWGVIHGMEAFIPAMLNSGAPCHIVNTASMNGLFPSARSAMYSATKYGVIGLTETYRNELAGTPVHLSVLCPAAVRSRIDESERNRPANLRAQPGGPEFVPSASYALSAPRTAEEIGLLLLDAIRDERFYIFTDASVRPYIEERHAQLLSDLDAVRRWDARQHD